MSDAKKPGLIARGLAKIADNVRVDGWLNALTGLGVVGKDKRMSGEARFELMSEGEAEELYAADDVAAKFVDTLPAEALREWLTCHCSDDDELAKTIDDKLDELHAHERLEKAWTWARLYGGSAILMNCDDSADLATPLDLRNVRDLQSLVVLSRWELRTTTMEIDLNLNSSRYGEPIFYHFAPRRGGVIGVGQRIHHTRLLRFDGVKLPVRLHITNQYWGDSVLNRSRNAIRNYNTAHDSAATILQEFNQGIFKITGLADMMMNGQEEDVKKRLEMVQLGRSVCRAVVIDATEDYSSVGSAVAGIPEMLNQVGSRLVVASNMPHDKILGDSPSGLGATGDSENRIWYDYVASQRELILRPKILRLLQVIFASRNGPTNGEEPETWSFEFNPLWQMDEQQLAAIRKTQSETDVAYITAQVLDPDEVAMSRFGTGKYSSETTLDLEARTPDGGLDPDPEEDPAAAPDDVAPEAPVA